MFLKIATVALICVGLAQAGPKRKLPGIGAAFDPNVPYDPYIVGGDTVVGREYPMQISLRFDGDHNCGGTILDKDWILTAGHCCKDYDAESLSVVTGSNLLSKGGVSHKVEKVTWHEEFDPSDSWKNDVCVIKVSPPITMEEGVAPVELETNMQYPADGTNATVVGWGRVSAWGDIPDDLRKAALPVVNQNSCQQDYQGEETIRDSQICAGGGGDKDACNGDSGGPLFVNNKQIGIVSWGRPCAVEGYPTVFTEVPKFIDWIKKNTQ
ncbi:chymotrypsin-2-like [Ischnura elegans]|uniref:chymotrypsin-2-like n=1 Tax=Ischnura elegans TaxID=197161 RepID=UPI001ED872D6|nr:chymotrypsin-2-like [Ischnura elegans]